MHKKIKEMAGCHKNKASNKRYRWENNNPKGKITTYWMISTVVFITKKLNQRMLTL